MATFSIEEQLKSVTDVVVKESALKKREQLGNILTTVYNIQIRDDSRLAWTFITEMPESEVHYVAREIWHTRLLHDLTPYGELCKDLLPLVKKELIEHRHMDPQKAWEHIQQFVLPYLQLDCMENVLKECNF